uniref:PCNA-associated factor n=1 Tax=Scophthalmus maximus TaxID=52904 RepID=A0A8D3BSY2_SCOMX
MLLSLFLRSHLISSSGSSFFAASSSISLLFAAVAASAPRKSLGSSSANASSCSTKGKYAGGNPVCPRPTPTWQKGIGDFFGGPPRKPEKENQQPQEVEDDEEAGGSGMSKVNRNLQLVHCQISPDIITD